MGKNRSYEDNKHNTMHKGTRIGWIWYHRVRTSKERNPTNSEENLFMYFKRTS